MARCRDHGHHDQSGGHQLCSGHTGPHICDAIAIIVAEIGQKDPALGDLIVHRLRAEEHKMTTEYPPDERGMKHP